MSTPGRDGLWSVGHLARRAGLTPKAVRYYDRIGLFRPAHIDAGGYRWYAPDQLAAAQLIARLRAVDVPLEEIRACVEDKREVRDVLTAQVRRLEARVTRIRGGLHEIAHLLIDLDTPEEAPSMTTDATTTDAATSADTGHTSDDDRRRAAALFNATWDLMEKEDRTRDDDDRMLHTAHASRYFWGLVGTPANVARGEWQCSRVYAVLRRPEPCLHHAQRVLDLCTEHGLVDWDLAFAHEALARAHAIAGDAEAARAETELALAVPIAEDDDRALLHGDLESIPGQQRFW